MITTLIDDKHYTLKLSPVSPVRDIKGRFIKGVASYIKGKKKPGWTNSGSFKKGHINKSMLPIGTIRLRKRYDRINSNYLYIKIAEPNKWIPQHRFIYEQKYGKIKKGYLVHFKDNNHCNLSIDNLEVISKRDNLKRNLNREKAGKSIRATNLKKQHESRIYRKKINS